MRSNYKQLGNYIEQFDIRNKDCNNSLELEAIKGISSISKSFIKTKANLVGVSPGNYKVVEPKQFGFNPNTARMGDKIPIALNSGRNNVLVSSIYPTFKILDANLLLPEYLMMWFRRPEFDRYARFKSHGSAREIFDYSEMCETELPIPSIEKQREIVKEYNTIVNCITLNEQLNQKLEETAQALYKHWFVDFEFPNENGQPYKSSGGKMVYNEELDQEIPEGWNEGKLSDICNYTSEREEITNLNTLTYLSTESMLPERGGIKESNNLPNAISTTKFNKGDILISNIRPYFKKIWMATFNGGCSNDILCLAQKEQVNLLYLYFTLEQNLFFEYVMKGAKGTKMPRGDKDWIMEFPIVIPNHEVENTFSIMVKSLDQKRNLCRDTIGLLKNLSTLILSKMSKVDTLQAEAI